MDTFNTDEMQQHLLEHTLPSYESLPSFGIYVDQLISYINEAVGLFYTPDEKLLTASMVNNYVKQGVVPKPEKKKYSRDHVAYIIVVCVLKKVLSIQEISKLVSALIAADSVQLAYDSFTFALSENLKACFSEESVSSRKASQQKLPLSSEDAAELLGKAVSSFASKLYVQLMLQD